jgi:opacity protein-like surface antigen
MKKILMSMAAFAALGSSTVYAESYPAYGENSYKAIHEGVENGGATGNFYVGLGYSYVNANLDIPVYYFNQPIEFDMQGDNISFLLGYDFNQYFALETRYTLSVTDIDFDLQNGNYDRGMSWGGDMSNFGLYLKPKYQSGAVTVYALLGYGHIRLDIDNIGDSSENEFQWGLGLSMDVGESIIAGTQTFIYLDYMRFYDDEMSQIDFQIDAVTAGIAFKF